MTTYDKTAKYNEIKKRISANVTIEPEKILIDYVVYFSVIDELFVNIEKLQKESVILFSKLRVTIFNSGGIEREYKNIIAEIETNIEKVRQLFGLKKDMCKKYSNLHDIKIIENMCRQKLNKFESIITNHQKMKSAHIDFYKALNKEDENFQYEKMEHYGTLNDAENNYEQTQEYNADMKIFIERNREIEALVNSITDLNQIFKDLSMMVNEQIESIDRIDLSMSETKTKTDSGIGELKKAQEEQKKCHIQ
jgi:hypothetical protein